MPIDRLLRTDQVIAVFHEHGMDDVNDNFIRHLMASKRLPYGKEGRFRRFRESAVLRVIAEMLEDAS